jgi:hypothetical protein
VSDLCGAERDSPAAAGRCDPGVEIEEQGPQDDIADHRVLWLLTDALGVGRRRGGVLEARQQVITNVPLFIEIEVAPAGIRGQQRAAFRPILVLGIDLQYLGTGVGRLTGGQSSAGPACDGIMENLVRPRKLEFRRPASDVLAMGPERLGEAVIHEDPVAAGDPIHHAIEDLLFAHPVVLLRFFGGVGVEPEQHEVVHGAAGLRDAESVDVLDIAREWIRNIVVVRLGIA